MSKFLKHISLITIFILIMANLLSYMSLNSLRNGSFYKSTYITHLNEKKLDYVILGSSTGLTTLNSKLIDSVTDLNGVNLAMDDTSMASHYLMLQHILAENIKMEYCILSPSFFAYDKAVDKLSVNDYRFLMYADRAYVREYYQNFESFDARILRNSSYIPMLGVSYYNMEIFFPSWVSLIQRKRRNRFDDKGNYSYPVTRGLGKEINKNRISYIQFSNFWFKKIERLCNENNIKLIAYIAPVANLEVRTANHDFHIINHNNLVVKSKNFYDNYHVNKIGREIASKDFSEKILSLIENPEDEYGR